MPKFGPIGQQVFDRTYSRTKEDNTKESFDEVVNRMVDGNLALVPEAYQLPNERERLIQYINDFKLVPAGRHWWVSGVPGRQFLFNCHRAGFTDRLADHVGFTFDELMKGGGVGANYSTEYCMRQEPIRRKVYVMPYISSHHKDNKDVTCKVPLVRNLPFGAVRQSHVVPDTREGWVHALTYICDLAQQEGPDMELIIELTHVRERGKRINGFGGLASGPGPLWECLSSVSEMLVNAVGRRLQPLEMMNIDHSIAACVVSGNVRRSARMSMMHWEDPEIFNFINVKHDGGHWTTNVSVEVDSSFFNAAKSDSNSHAGQVLQAVAAGMLHNGEPGLYNSELSSKGEYGDVRCSNPCGEIALEEWENCNLGHVNLARIESDDEAKECAMLMTRWLMRATFSDGMCWRQKEVVNRNRRIGVGVLGYQEWLWTKFGYTYSDGYTKSPVREWLTALRETVDVESIAFATELNIATPVKTTTIAPTGTTSQMVGATAGVHPVYAKYFIRRVRYADTDEGLKHAREQGLIVEEDNNNPNTFIVLYPCADPITELVPDDKCESVDEIELRHMLGTQAMVQKAWANNAVSFTVNLQEGAVEQSYLAGNLLVWGPQLKGTTVMVDGTYEQAPFERVTREAFSHLGTDELHAAASAPDCVGACPIR